MRKKTGYKVGDKVVYKDYKGDYKNGMVKSVLNETHCFVVYFCANDWENYKKYTGIKTRNLDMVHGWLHESLPDLVKTKES